MGKLKNNNKENKEIEVTVEPQQETPNLDVEVTEDIESNENFKDEESKLEVDTSPIEEKVQATPKNVRIRMRQDHRCWVGNELYDLKKGQCYNVPVGVKKRLNKAGLLLPI